MHSYITIFITAKGISQQSVSAETLETAEIFNYSVVFCVFFFIITEWHLCDYGCRQKSPHTVA